MRGGGRKTLAKWLVAAAALVALLAGLLLFGGGRKQGVATAAGEDAGAIVKYKTEPEVRIGILQKATHAKIKFGASYRAFVVGKGSPKEIRSRGPETIQVELYTVKLDALPRRLRVVHGAYRSYEQAEAALENLGELPFPAVIAQPKQWTVWFGPFNSPDEAQYAVNLIKKRGGGGANPRIEYEKSEIAVLTLYSSDGSFVHLGADPVVFYPAGGTFTMNARKYRGTVEVAPDAYGTFNVINRVKADDYLLSVLPREMPSKSAPESLKAQAVIARTYLMRNLRRHAVDNFNLCSTTDCQVYGGMGDEVASTTEAVKQTRGQALTSGGRLVNAVFHSTCGGRTASFSDIWNGDPPTYLTSVDDGAGSGADLSSEAAMRKFLAGKTGDCSDSKYFRWEKKFATNELLKVIQQTIPEFSNQPDLKIGALNGVSVTKYAKSGRVLEIVVDTDAGKFTFSKDAIRWVFGSLKSTFFVLDVNDTASGREYVFSGAGWGHGVGLCQFGAMRMGKDGRSYLEILRRYYPGAVIDSLWK